MTVQKNIKSRRKKGSGTVIRVREKYRAEIKFKHPVTGKSEVLRGELRERKKDAEVDLKELQDKRETLLGSQNIDSTTITVEEYYKKVFLPYKKEINKGQTYKRFESTVIAHIIPYLGTRPLMDLTSNEIDKRIKTISKTFSFSSTIKVYNAFSSMFSFAMLNGDISFNPMNRVPRPREDRFKKSEQKWLRPEDIAKFEKAATVTTYQGTLLYKYAHLYLFMLNCGLREGEAASLSKSDFDFEKKTLTVNKNLNIIKIDDDSEKGYHYAITVSTPKNANSVRMVPLNDEAIKYAKLIMEGFPDGDKLIYSNTGNYVRPEVLIKQFQAILRRAGIEKMGLHALRHTFVSVLFENDVDIYTIASIIGDEVSTVQKTYLHLYKERKARAVNSTNVITAAKQFSE